MAVQKLDAIDGMNQRQNRHFFTSYPEMNEVLNRFAAEADADEIWISAEVQELKENRSGNQLCQIVGMALDTAKRNCIETTPPRGRYIRIRCRDMQEQTFSIPARTVCFGNSTRLSLRCEILSNRLVVI